MEMTLLQMSLETNKTPERELCDCWKSNDGEQAWQVSGFTEAGKPWAIRMSQSLSGECALDVSKDPDKKFRSTANFGECLMSWH